MTNYDLHIVLVDHLQNQRRNTKIKKKAGNSWYNYQNELDKASFQYEMAYEDFKVLTRRTASDKLLHNKVFNIAKNTKHDGGYQRGSAPLVYNFFW